MQFLKSNFLFFTNPELFFTNTPPKTLDLSFIIEIFWYKIPPKNSSDLNSYVKRKPYYYLCQKWRNCCCENGKLLVLTFWSGFTWNGSDSSCYGSVPFVVLVHPIWIVVLFTLLLLFVVKEQTRKYWCWIIMRFLEKSVWLFL